MFEKIYKPLIFFQLILIIYLGWLIIKEKKENLPLKKNYANYQNMVQSLEAENKQLKEKLEYLSHPENFKKELKEKFNLTEPGEKMIILPENF
jgi:cell division protein FtsB